MGTMKGWGMKESLAAATKNLLDPRGEAVAGMGGAGKRPVSAEVVEAAGISFLGIFRKKQS